MALTPLPKKYHLMIAFMFYVHCAVENDRILVIKVIKNLTFHSSKRIQEVQFVWGELVVLSVVTSSSERKVAVGFPKNH